MNDQSAQPDSPMTEAPPSDRWAQIKEFLGGPLGVATAYVLLATGMAMLLGINEESNRTNGLYYLVPGMVITSLVIVYSVSAVGHVLAARVLGFRVVFFALGPLVLIEEDQRGRRVTNSWHEVGRYAVQSSGIGPSRTVRVAAYLLEGVFSTILTLWVVTPIWNAFVGEDGRPDTERAPLVFLFFLFFLTFIAWGWAFAMLIGGLLLPGLDMLRGKDHICHHLSHLDPPRPRPMTRAEERDRENVLKLEQLVNSAAPERSDVRPRDWDIAPIMAAVEASKTVPPDPETLLRAYFHELDKGAVAEAGHYLVRATNVTTRQTSPHPRAMLEAAYFFARFRRDNDTARLRLSQAQPDSKRRHVALRAEAAILLADQQYLEAIERATDAIGALPRAVTPGLAEAEEDWLVEIIAQARLASLSTAP